MTEQEETQERIRQIGAVIDATRALFHRMKATAEQVHKETETTAGLRGVLQDLHHNGPRSVPDMARTRPVSRQHIQVLVNKLLERKEVDLILNPSHARSHLVRLTDLGKASVEAIRRREAELLERLPLEARTDELAKAAKVLRGLKAAFEDPEWLILVERTEASKGGRNER